MKFRTPTFVLILFVLSALSMGQGQGTTATGVKLADSSFLLLRTDVQGDLQLTGGQKAQLEALHQKMIHPPKRGSGASQNWVGSRAQMGSEMAQINQRAEAVLLEQQRARLLEIKIQLLGNTALLDPTVEHIVGITEEQKGQIVGLQEQQQAKIRDQLRSGNLRGNQVVKAIQSSQQQVGAAMEKLLTAEQATKLKEAKGRTFHPDAGQ